MTASTEQYPQPSSNDPTVYTDARGPAGPGGPDDDRTTGRMQAVPAPGAPRPAEDGSTVRRAGRVVSRKVAAIIGVVAFLLGAGLALLVGGLTGPGGTPPDGAGGPGGAPGTSQSSTQSSTGTSSTGT